MTVTPQSTIDIVREMYAAVAAYSDIGDAIGATRNAVAGLVNRRCQDLTRPETVPVRRMSNEQRKRRTELSEQQFIERLRLTYIETGTVTATAAVMRRRTADISRLLREHASDLMQNRQRQTRSVDANPDRKPRPIAPPIALVVSNPVSFTAAKGCRYPLWAEDADLSEKNVCGASCEPGRSFCAGHHALAYRTVQRRAA